MPNLNTRRMGPGIFQSKDDKYMYVIGGKTAKIERISTKEDATSWETIDA